ncbi:MAG: CoA transferase [Betaproteobacteria bacterium]|nr:CoA transferase [Betaproteobacteria bacterium]
MPCALARRRRTDSLWWKVIARNKRTITLNLSTKDGQQVLRKLVEDADVLVENYRPGTFERWGLGYEELAKINPRLVFVRVSGYGQTGPYSQRGGYGTIAEAFSGIPSFTGFPDGPPTLMSSFALADSTSATFAAMAAMFAIYERDQGGSGKGREVDVSLYEPLFRLAEAQAIAYDQLKLVRKRIGNRSTTDSPRNAYKTHDGGYVTISAGTQKSFDRLTAAIGMPELSTDERFTDAFSRQRNADELDAIIAGWFLKQDLPNALDILGKGEVVQWTHLHNRGHFQRPAVRLARKHRVGARPGLRHDPHAGRDAAHDANAWPYPPRRQRTRRR